MKKRLPYYIAYILTLCLGVFLFSNAEQSLEILSKIIGVVCIIYAIARTISMFVAKKREALFTLGIIINIAIVVLGVLIMTNSFGLSAILGLIIAIYILLDALWKLRIAFAAKKFSLPHWYILLLISAVNIIIAIVALTNVSSVAKVSIQLIALGIVCDSVLNLLSLAFQSKIDKSQDN
mgnify:CR=1 FL=1